MCLWLKENWFKVSILTLVIIIVGGWFYWHELHPTKIRKECRNSATESVNSVFKYGYTHDDEPRLYDTFYQNCIKGRYGLLE